MKVPPREKLTRSLEKAKCCIERMNNVSLMSGRMKCLHDNKNTYLRVAMADREEQPGPGNRYVACSMMLPRVFHSHSEVMGPARQEVSV